VDVGAGMGEDAYVYSRAAGNTGRVVAIEAHPATFSTLAAFVRLNHLANIATLHVAASNTRETLVISSLPDGDWQCNSIMGGASHGGAEVQAVPLDEIDVIAARPVVDFIKMNIEGAEVLALRGAERTLAKTRHICVCCHDFLGDETRTKDQVCSILEQAGFALSFTSPHSPPYERDFVYGVRLI